jgi:hypothetical protein
MRRAEVLPVIAWRTWFVGLVMGIGVCLSALTVQARDVHDTDGLALGAGIGMSVGGVGASASYHIQWPERRLSLRPHVGVGWFDASVPGHAAGIAGAFGRRHRVIVDVQLATFGVQQLVLYGEELEDKLIYGIGLAAGWEWLSRSGFFVRASIGPAFAFLPPLYQRAEAYSVNLNLIELGAKLW